MTDIITDTERSVEQRLGALKKWRCLIPDRFAEHLTENSYGARCYGACLEPVICNGDFVVMTPEQKQRAGDFALFWPRDDGQPFIKRLVMPFLVDPAVLSPNSGCIPLAIVETLNPPCQFEIAADRIRAVHAVVGWVKPGECKREPLENARDAVRAGVA